MKTDKIRVTVWNENIHEVEFEEIRKGISKRNRWLHCRISGESRNGCENSYPEGAGTWTDRRSAE